MQNDVDVKVSKVFSFTMANRDWSSISKDCCVLFMVFTSVLELANVSVLAATSCFRVSDCQWKNSHELE